MSRPRALTRSTSERTTNPMPELATRVASALVLAALAIGAALISPWTFLLLVIAASCVIAWEWGRLTRGDGSDRIAIVQMIGVALRSDACRVRPACLSARRTRADRLGHRSRKRRHAVSALGPCRAGLCGVPRRGADMAQQRCGARRRRGALPPCRGLDHRYGRLRRGAPDWRSQARAPHLTPQDLERLCGRPARRRP